MYSLHKKKEASCCLSSHIMESIFLSNVILAKKSRLPYLYSRLWSVTKIPDKRETSKGTPKILWNGKIIIVYREGLYFVITIVTLISVKSVVKPHIKIKVKNVFSLLSSHLLFTFKLKVSKFKVSKFS